MGSLALLGSLYNTDDPEKDVWTFDILKGW